MKTLASTCPICFTAHRRRRVLRSRPAWAEGLRQHDHHDHHGHHPPDHHDHHHYAVQVSPAIEVVDYSQGKFLHFNIQPLEIGLGAFVISVWWIIDWLDLDLVQVMLSRVSSLRAAALAEERELQVCRGPIIGNNLICVVPLFWTSADWSGLIIKWATGTQICCA